jgi:hypothetical protein
VIDGQEVKEPDRHERYPLSQHVTGAQSAAEKHHHADAPPGLEVTSP